MAAISIDASTYPTVTLKVAAPVPPAEQGEQIPASAFDIVEDGAAREVTAVGPADTPLETVLLVDTSAGTSAAVLSAAVGALAEFLLQVPDYGRVSVVTFGGDATVLAPMTADPAEALADLEALQPGGERALYDAVVLGVDQFTPTPSNRRSMVLLATGPDAAGTAALSDATRALAGSRSSLYVVDATVDEPLPDGIDALASAAGGGILSAEEPGDLLNLYDRVALRLGNEYRLTFQAEGDGPTDVTVRFSFDGITDELTRTLDFPAAPPATAQPPTAQPRTETVPTATAQAPPLTRGDDGEVGGLLDDVTVAVGLLVAAVALFAAGMVAFFWFRSASRTPAATGMAARDLLTGGPSRDASDAGPMLEGGDTGAMVAGGDPAAVLAGHGQAAARPGDVGYLVVAGDEPRDKPLPMCRRMTVAITIVDPADRRTLAAEGPDALLRNRVERIARQVEAAGGVATVEDLACLTATHAQAIHSVVDGLDIAVRGDRGATEWDEALETGATRPYRWGVQFTRDEERSVGAHFSRHGTLPVQPGDLCLMAISAEEPLDKQVRACRRVPVRVQLATATDVLVANADGPVAMRRRRLGRVARQAQVQNGLLTTDDLAQALGVASETVSGDMLALRIAGQAVPVFGQVQVGDLGPAPEAAVVARYLCGGMDKLGSEERTLLAEFADTVRLHRHGRDVGEIQAGTPAGTALLGQYVALYERARRERDGGTRLAELLDRELAASRRPAGGGRTPC